MSKKKIILTGALGFCGSNVSRYLLKDSKHYEIVGVDYVVDPKLIHSIHLNKNNKFYFGDIRDTHFLDNVFKLEKPDIIIHMADSKGSVKECIDTNITGTQNLIDMAKKHSIAKFMHISSDKVCGDSVLNDNDHMFPITPYAITKYTADLLLKKSELKDFVIVRPCNIFGPRQSESFLIPSIIKNIIEEQPVTLYNDGLNLRDYLYITDFAAALKVILESGTETVYHVTSGWELSSLDLFKNISDIFNMKNYPLNFIESQSQNVRKMNSLYIKTPGWKTEFKYKEALNTTVNWYVNNYQWFLK